MSAAAVPDEATAALNRFPGSGRRRVTSLTRSKTFFGLFFLVVYVFGFLLAYSLINGLGWFSDADVLNVSADVCIGILCLPLIGYAAGLRLLFRCRSVSKAAALIDDHTQGLFDNVALQSQAREVLAADYDKHAATNIPLVNALRADALRRAFVDRWEPSSWLVDAHWPQLSNGLLLIQTLQRMALQVGLLFTFIGLAMAFSSDAFTHPAEIYKIGLGSLVSALRVKFMSSIAGLVSSISLLGLIWACRHELNRCTARLEAMVDNILTLAKTMRSDPKFASDFTLLREGVSRVDSRVEGLAAGYSNVVTTLRNGMTDLAQAREDFVAKLQAMLQTQQKAASDIETFYRQISPQGLSGELGKVLKENTESFARTLRETADTMEELNVSVEKLTATEQRRTQDEAKADSRHQETIGVLRSLRHVPGTAKGDGQANGSPWLK